LHDEGTLQEMCSLEPQKGEVSQQLASLGRLELNPEEGGSMFLQNVSIHLEDSTLAQP
jgi:hypothetical protein